RVVAEDDAGALGPPSAEVSADALADETAPSIPGTLSAVAGVGTITLSWGAATDNVAVAQYTIHRATSAGITPSEANQIAAVGQLTYVDIAAPGTYYFRVVAEDGAGNRGPPSNEVSSVSAQAPPSAPGTLKATGGVGQVSLSWGAATDDVGIASYHVHRAASAGFTPGAGNLIATPSGLSYVDSVNPGTYYYVVIPVDLGGLSGPASNEASGVSADDTTAPGAPGTLSATGGVRQISLSWGAASDNVGVVGYNVYRSSTAGFIAGPGNLLKQVNGTSTTDTNILGTYYYRVTARDAAGNIGSVSNQASAVAAQALSYTFTANYSGGCPFTIYNNAACGTEVRLTSAASSERGAAYMKNTVTLSNDTSFNVSFRLQFDQPHASGMADGIVFVIRKDTAPPIGHPSGNIGYEGSPPLDAIAAPSVAPSVGVEFDTYRGPTDPGTDDGHIAIVKDGLNTALASHLSYADYTFGSTYVYAWVDYDGIANVLRVYASSSSTKPASPLITYTINIPSVIGGSSVYFGFTGATGGFYARQRFGPFTLNTYD
ncbi:MAG: hypothetical protein KC417_12715, partial [Myxococcales bacterium]|nr:hypothetical protein [Myxococcales bacterium]